MMTAQRFTEGLRLTDRLIEEYPDLSKLLGPEAPERPSFEKLVASAVEHGMRIAWNRAAGRRTCRTCGCWELQACDGVCWWTEDDLCSTCDAYGPPPEVKSNPLSDGLKGDAP